MKVKGQIFHLMENKSKFSHNQEVTMYINTGFGPDPQEGTANIQSPCHMRELCRRIPVLSNSLCAGLKDPASVHTHLHPPGAHRSRGKPETLEKSSGTERRTLLLQLQWGHRQERLSLGVCGHFTPVLSLFFPSRAIAARSTPQTVAAQRPPLHRGNSRCKTRREKIAILMNILKTVPA